MPLITTRRRLLTGLASSFAVAPFLSCAPRRDGPTLAGDPFTLGVASGDPDATSVVLWTRLAPAPLQADGGLPPRAIPVEWAIASDEAMRQIVAKGIVEARPEEGHSLHVVAQGLSSDRPYWYRFTTKDAQSRIGRTRTLPAPGAAMARFKIAVAGCQRFEQGYYTAWADIAAADLDAVFHYGDYIYEYALKREVVAARAGRAIPDEVLPRLTQLSHYRLRYALYKLDPDLAAAHAAHPFFQSFDDHEVTNDWGGPYSGSYAMSEAEYRAMRVAALQAYYENAPLRPTAKPQGPSIKAYRSVDVGNLVRLAVLDTRQYRSAPACGKAATQHCDDRLAPGRSMIGTEQERWLIDLFGRRDTAWTLLGNQVMLMQNLYKDPAAGIVDTDKWDGNPDARKRLLQAAVDRKVSGLVVVTGDIHRSFAGDVKVDYEKPGAPVVGSEFVATSIASGGDGAAETARGKRILALNPHMKFYDGRRGYLTCSFDRTRCQTDYRGLETVSRRGAPITTIASLTVDAKKPGVA